MGAGREPHQVTDVGSQEKRLRVWGEQRREDAEGVGGAEEKKEQTWAP